MESGTGATGCCFGRWGFSPRTGGWPEEFTAARERLRLLRAQSSAGGEFVQQRKGYWRAAERASEGEVLGERERGGLFAAWRVHVQTGGEDSQGGGAWRCYFRIHAAGRGSGKAREGRMSCVGENNCGRSGRDPGMDRRGQHWPTQSTYRDVRCLMCDNGRTRKCPVP